MFSSYDNPEFVKERVRYVLPGISAQSIRNDIANEGYMKSSGGAGVASPESNFATTNIYKEVNSLSNSKDGIVTFYAFLVKRITELKRAGVNDPFFDKYSYEFKQLFNVYDYPGKMDEPDAKGNIHILRELLFKYQDEKDNKRFSVKNEIPVLKISNPDGSKNVFYKDEFLEKGNGYTKLLKRLINKLVAKEALDRVRDLSSGGIQQPDPFYYEQARKVLNGGNASYQGPSSDGGADFSLTNLAGYQNIQYIGAGLGVLAFTLIGGTVLAKIRD